jgi:hypothetical protein
MRVRLGAISTYRGLAKVGGTSHRDGIMLAPGAVFCPHLERSPWMLLNVTVCEDTRVQRWLQRQTASEADLAVNERCWLLLLI